jgi:hypothetical protein
MMNILFCYTLSMARKKKKLTKAQRRKIAIRNLKKAWKANRKGRKARSKKRRKNPKKRSKRKVRKRKKAKRKTRRRSKRKRRNPRISSVYSAKSCASPWSRRFNPEDELDELGINPVANSIAEMGLSYAYNKPRRRWNPEGEATEEVVAVAEEVAAEEVVAPSCDCGTCPTHGKLVSAARRLRRRNPGWSFKQGRATRHAGGGELSRFPRRSRHSRLSRPRRWNPQHHMGGRMEGVYSAGACRRNPRLDSPGGVYSIGAC